MTRRLSVVVLAAAVSGCTPFSASRTRTTAPSERAARPVLFERNDGQAARTYRFVAHGPAFDAGFTAHGVVLATNDRHVAFDFVGAAEAVVSGDAPLAAHVNYLRGRNASQWQTRVPTYARVRYTHLYDRVDAVFYVAGRTLEYDLTIGPYGDPRSIAMRVSGADSVAIDGDGNLVVSAGGRAVVHHKPIAYQETNSARTPIDAAYRLAESTITFALGPYDASRPLTIDPVISASTLIGGSDNDQANAVAVDAAGNVYVAGQGASFDFPGATNEHAPGVDQHDVFVCKFTPDVREVVFCTYIGGASMDFGNAVAVDAAGHAVVAGATESSDFPTTAGALKTSCACPQDEDGFVATLAADGASFVYSTLLGGSRSDQVRAVAVDGSGRAHVAGWTVSSDFPVTAGAAQQHAAGNGDGFVATLNADGKSLAYASYLGGSQPDSVAAIALDAAGNTYVAGDTKSSNLPVVAALQSSLMIVPGNAVNTDGFFARFNSDGALTVCSYFGGGNRDGIVAIAANATGVYLAGQTDSPTLPPMTSGSHPAGEAAFVTQLTPDALHARVTTFLDGDNNENASGLALDGANVHVVGSTFSRTFPVTADAPEPSPLTPAPNLPLDAFYTIFPIASGGAMQTTPSFSTLLGGTSANLGQGIAGDGHGGVYIAGIGQLADFPAINAARRYAGNEDGFVAHFVPNAKFVTTTSGDVVLWSTDATRVQGQYSLVADPSAAGGRRLANADAAAPKVTTPAASPANFIEFTFLADAGTAYHLWIRGKALKDSVNNDSVYAQFSDSVDASGHPLWRIGTTSAAPIIIENCTNCGIKGWGWNDNAYGVGIAPQLVRFAATGTHTIRIQPREDGLSIDQVVLSSSTYLATAPGGPKDTTVVLGRSAAAPPPSSDACTAGETVIYAATAPHATGWNVVSDATAAGGSRLFNPDAGAPKIATAMASPSSFFDVGFTADAAVDYRIWIRGKALNDFWGNDSVFVQFNDSVTSSDTATWRIGTTSATAINLEDCSGCGLKGWGWQDNGWGAGVLGPLVRFAASGAHTIRIQTREDGLSVDQIVLSSGKYLTSAPGSLKDDTTILPACSTPPLR